MMGGLRSYKRKRRAGEKGGGRTIAHVGRRQFLTCGHRWTQKHADWYAGIAKDGLYIDGALRGRERAHLFTGRTNDVSALQIDAECKRQGVPPLYAVAFKSRAEANWARFLEALVHRQVEADGPLPVNWLYEPCEFEFPIKRGTTTYRPDFLVIFDNDYWELQEVKGMWDAKSKTRHDRFRRHFPQLFAEHYSVIEYAQVKAIDRKLRHVIPGWEAM